MTETMAATSSPIHLNGTCQAKATLVGVGSKRCHLGEIIANSHSNGTNGSAVLGIGSPLQTNCSNVVVTSGGSNGNGSSVKKNSAPKTAESKRYLWFEEELEADLRWLFGASKILQSGVSEFQDIQLVQSGPFGKVLLLDGKLQSAEADEHVYHESLVHPACLFHTNPRSIFIMGGGEGSTAREVLKHHSVKKVVMCDIDQEVVDFCRMHLIANTDAFRNRRLELVIDCARTELERRNERFDIIIGDLADPVDGGPCYRLYTKSFYESVVKPKLMPGGIFVTQGGPAGILSHTHVFSSICNTLRQVFKHVVPYAAHIPSYADTWGWIMASDHPLPASSPAEIDSKISHRLMGDLRFLDGTTFMGLCALNKQVRQSLQNETHVYTEETARFIHGQGHAQNSKTGT